MNVPTKLSPAVQGESSPTPSPHDALETSASNASACKSPGTDRHPDFTSILNQVCLDASHSPLDFVIRFDTRQQGE